jgi:purine-binding chemotaxis protein CheW
MASNQAQGDAHDTRDGITDPYLAFRVGQIWFAARAELIDEICEAAEPTPLPLAPAHIPGVINLRGQAVPLLDLRLLFDVQSGAGQAAAQDEVSSGARGLAEHDDLFSRIAVATANGMRVGMLCDQVRGVVEVPRSERRRPEVALGARLLEFVEEEYHQDEGLILLLDLVKLLNTARVQR